MFGVPTWKVADRCVAWIRKWDPKIEHMHDFGGRERPSGHSDYTMGAEESFQSYGAYLARHALALEAGRLFQTTPLQRGRYTTTNGTIGSRTIRQRARMAYGWLMASDRVQTLLCRT